MEFDHAKTPFLVYNAGTSQTQQIFKTRHNKKSLQVLSNGFTHYFFHFAVITAFICRSSST